VKRIVIIGQCIVVNRANVTELQSSDQAEYKSTTIFSEAKHTCM